MKEEIWHGDCLELMKDIPDKSIDMILCDLPYGTTACKWDTIIPFEPLWEQYRRIIKDNGAIVLTASQPFTSALVMSNVSSFSHQWIWEKEQGSNPLTARKMPMKNFEDVLVFYEDHRDLALIHPLRKHAEKIASYIGYSRKKLHEVFNNYRFQHFLESRNNKNFSLIQKDMYEILTEKYSLVEMDGYMTWEEMRKIDKIFDLQKRTYNPQMLEGKPYEQKSGRIGEVYGRKLEGHVTKNSGTRFPGSIVFFSRDKTKLHPTQKPVALFEYLIRTYTNEGDIVLDSCAGSGTTGIACKNLNRQFILIEKEQEYIDIINKRLSDNNNKI